MSSKNFLGGKFLKINLSQMRMLKRKREREENPTFGTAGIRRGNRIAIRIDEKR